MQLDWIFNWEFKTLGLLSEIQNEAVNSNSNVASLLRKCLLLAARLDSAVLEDWVKYELNGYPPKSTLPEYRIFQLTVKGYFSGPFGASIGNAPIAPLLIKKITGSNNFDKFFCRQAITTINNAKEVRNTGIGIVSLDDLALLISNKVYRDYHALKVWGEINPMELVGVIEAVKTRILELTLALEKKFPNAGEIGGMNKKSLWTKKDAQETVQNIIYGNVGFAGSANNSTVNVAFNPGDIEALNNYFKQQGVSQTDLQNLEDAIRSESQIGENKKFGPKVAAWIGKMVGKAASGSWEASIETASTVLTCAILRYYGFN